MVDDDSEAIRRRMEEEAQSLEEARLLRKAVKSFSSGELLSAYVILEKLGVAQGSNALEKARYRLAVQIYRAELMARLNRGEQDR